MTGLREYIVPSKINLGLEILSRRPDGYHEINTVFYRTLEPHDVITVSDAEFFRITCSDPSLVGEGNLMYRAAHRFADQFGLELPSIEVHLEKRIPMGAGLGGGSSDAATMLSILSEFSNGISVPAELTASIGADVPFFFTGAKAAVATGIGEQLTPIDFDLHAAVLIVLDPAIHVSTREAYAGLRLPLTPIATNFADLFDGAVDLSDLQDHLRNDFEATVFQQYPKLSSIKQSLLDRGADLALMSGSGSAIFGLFEDVSVAEDAKRWFEADDLLVFLS
ncbi:MAG: 4-(cytidine 5'-diphospho)-2-C-methyl-D-erythritol kinase [Bacteroidota bacterium]|nr:4-(cytidine 5'-diphospho)-2-C-methyl-D-erythritol kinase [Bacteroidota bacterium]MDP4231943.1 4-(cytidine 5'-diphospho)-2-C-methyl-D-erythritol kinase [Bacteroidota bacterium]MDP4241350.1 4-(cytidine 5'-diphospho)-2-C-methyl-D-erythritol kinase [Bacteroidota bacterium]MDP4287271.1 4-(cytidine 5'-diphospho)-2-C-methyl-D-erythritol kinase [Bacteroidota bacterium]